MDPHHAIHPGFSLPDVNRRDITAEDPPAGSRHDPHHQDVDWIGPENQGGGFVPPDFEWRSNPKQEHDDVGCG